MYLASAKTEGEHQAKSSPAQYYSYNLYTSEMRTMYPKRKSVVVFRRKMVRRKVVIIVGR